jgi:hypothetical protein
MHTSRVAVEFRILWLPIFQRDVKANFFVVENTTRFCKNLQPIIAAFNFPHRDNGSNGKTIVKEWLNFY